MLFCGSPTELPTAWPADWGEKFVCKPLAAYTAMRGVLLLQRGVDKLSGQRFRGRDDVVELFANTTTRPKASSILCEELVDGADGRPAARERKRCGARKGRAACFLGGLSPFRG